MCKSKHYSNKKMERNLLTFPTWEKYMVLSNTVEMLKVKEKRYIFNCLRNHECTPHSFFPVFGFTTSEFAVWQVLGDGRKSRQKRQTSTND